MNFGVNSVFNRNIISSNSIVQIKAYLSNSESPYLSSLSLSSASVSSSSILPATFFVPKRSSLKKNKYF